MAAGSIVVLHHPPLFVDAVPFMESVVLRDPAALGEVLTGTDARIDVTAPSALARGVLGAGATIVDLSGAFAPVFHTVHGRDHVTGEDVPEE